MNQPLEITLVNAMLINHGLILEAEENCERDCSDVWVHTNTSYGHHCSSYAVAVNEGILECEDHPNFDWELDEIQLNWLNGPEVRDWLDTVNY